MKKSIELELGKSFYFVMMVVVCHCGSTATLLSFSSVIFLTQQNSCLCQERSLCVMNCMSMINAILVTVLFELLFL